MRDMMMLFKIPEYLLLPVTKFIFPGYASLGTGCPDQQRDGGSPRGGLLEGIPYHVQLHSVIGATVHLQNSAVQMKIVEAPSPI
jgi:hypothetical protein